MVLRAREPRISRLITCQLTARAFLVLAAVELSFPRDAHAYLDPGTGSLIIQGLIASVAAGLIVVRAYWGRLKSFYKKSPPKESTDGGRVDDAEQSDDG